MFPGLLGSKAVLLLIFGGNPTLLPTVAAPIYNPTHSAQGPLFSMSLPALAISCLFGDSHSDGYEVVSCGFDLHFPDD